MLIVLWQLEGGLVFCFCLISFHYIKCKGMQPMALHLYKQCSSQQALDWQCMLGPVDQRQLGGLSFPAAMCMQLVFSPILSSFSFWESLLKNRVEA